VLQGVILDVNQKQAVEASMVPMFRAVARLAIEQGLTYQTLSHLLRHAMIDVAPAVANSQGVPSNDSQLALMTGLTRREIKRLRETPTARRDTPKSISDRVAEQWLINPRFCDDQAAPKPLMLKDTAGAPTFDELVSSVTTDIRPRALLEQWSSRGFITITEDDFVLLNRTAFFSRTDMDVILTSFSQVVSSAIDSHRDAMMQVPNAGFLRLVETKPLSGESRAAMKVFVKQLAEETQLRVVQKARALLATQATADTHESHDLLHERLQPLIFCAFLGRLDPLTTPRHRSDQSP
jgi:hypothetical protein